MTHEKNLILIEKFAIEGAKDGHRNGKEIINSDEFNIVVELVNTLVCLGTTNHRYCSLNPIRIPKNKDYVYLSSGSVGGVLCKDDFKTYNENCSYDEIKIARAYKIIDKKPELVFEDKELIEASERYYASKMETLNA